MKLVKIVLVFSFVVISGCASIPNGWIKDNDSYIQTEVGLSFPVRTDNLEYKDITGATSVTHSDAVHYEATTGGLSLTAYIRYLEGDVSYEDYFGYSKIAIVQENALQRQLPEEILTLTHKGRTYQGKIFRGYGTVLPLEDREFTVLHSFITFDLDDFYFKLRSTRAHLLGNESELSTIREQEKELLMAVFDSVE